MSRLLKLLLLMVTLLGKTNMNGVANKESSSIVGQQLSKLLKKSNAPLSVFLLSGYLRLFAPAYFLDEMKKIIYNYAGTINHYPYARVSSEPKPIMTEKIEKGMHFLVSLSANNYAAIYEKKLIFMRCTKERGAQGMIPNRLLLKDPSDTLYCLFPLEDEPPYFSFLVLTEAGAINYISGSTEGSVDAPKRIPHFSNQKLNKVYEKISFCRGKQPSTFFVLLNSPSPILFVYNVEKGNQNQKLLNFIQFNTSEFHKNSDNNLQNLLFLGKNHFVMLNHHPKLGSRVFLYNMQVKNPIGYISVDKKYCLLSSFSHDSLSLLSLSSPSMMVFCHVTQNFIDLPSNSQLLPLMTIPHTKQVIMTYMPTSKKEEILKSFKQGRFLLCNLRTNHPPTIQHVFDINRGKNTIQVLTIQHYALNEVLLHKLEILGKSDTWHDVIEVEKEIKHSKKSAESTQTNILSFKIKKLASHDIDKNESYSEVFFTLIREKNKIDTSL